MENNHVSSIEIAFANAIIVRLINELEDLKNNEIATVFSADCICKLQNALDVIEECYYDAKLIDILENNGNTILTISQTNDANTELGEEGEYVIKVDGVPVAEFGGVEFLRKCLWSK